jgi:hypothetical protein
MEFEVETLKDTTLIKLGDTLVVRRIPTPMENPNITHIFSKTQNKSKKKQIENPLY